MVEFELQLVRRKLLVELPVQPVLLADRQRWDGDLQILAIRPDELVPQDTASLESLVVVVRPDDPTDGEHWGTVRVDIVEDLKEAEAAATLGERLSDPL